MKRRALLKKNCYPRSFAWIRGKVYLREVLKSNCHVAGFIEICLLNKDNVCLNSHRARLRLTLELKPFTFSDIMSIMVDIERKMAFAYPSD